MSNNTVIQTSYIIPKTTKSLECQTLSNYVASPRLDWQRLSNTQSLVANRQLPLTVQDKLVAYCGKAHSQNWSKNQLAAKV